MAAPNIVNVSSIYGKSNIANVTTAYSNLVVNSASSGKVLKLNTLYAANRTGGTSDGSITIEFVRNGEVAAIANNITVPANATIDVVTKPFYLEEGDYVRVSGAANSKIYTIASYEDMS